MSRASHRIFAAGLGALALALPAPTQAGNGRWTSNGPDGGVIYELHYDPNQADTIYLTSRGGFFKSSDGGLSWTASNNGLLDITNNPLVVDAEAPGHLYVFDFGMRLYRSTDYGDTWTPTGYTLPGGVYPWFAADEPGSSGRFFLTVSTVSGSISQPMLWKTSDDGASFAVAGSGLPNAGMAYLQIEPGTPNHLLVGVESQDPPGPVVYRSLDGGSSWTGVGPPAYGCAAIGFGAGTYPNRRVYAGIEGVLHRSDDSGATWTATTTPVYDLLAHPTLADTLFFVDYDLSIGMQRSDDGGDSATPLTNGLSSNPSYVDASAVPVPVHPFSIVASPDFPAPSSSLWIATQGDGLFRSVDGGNTWSASNLGLRAGNFRALAVHPNPLAIGGDGASRYLYAGFADAGYSSPALFRSIDSGSNWSPLNNGLRASNLRALLFDPTTAGVGAAPPLPPLGAATIYAAGRSSLAGYPPDRYRNAGLYKSSNGGLNWSVIEGGLPRIASGSTSYADLGWVRALAIDPRSCASPPPSGPCINGPLQTLYAAADGQRVTTVDTASVPGTRRTTRTSTFQLIRSDDAGSNWVRLDDAGSGFPLSRNITTCPASPTPPNNCIGSSTTESAVAMRPAALVLSPTQPGTAYVGIWLVTAPWGTSPPPDPVTGIYKTVDAGATWSAVNNGLPLRTGSTSIRQDVLALAIHPSNDQVLWATTVELPDVATGTIYKTVDGGATWTESGDGLRGRADIRALTVDASDASGNTLYAAGGGTPSNPGAVYKSEDGGAHWRSISVGLPVDSALAIAVDPFRSEVVHAGTNTGVWSLTQVPDGDGDGIPDATENNAPNGGDGNADSQQDAAQRDVGSSVIIYRRPGGSGGFFTSDVLQANSTPTSTGGCEQAVDVQALAAAQFGRDDLPDHLHHFKYPRDLVRFEVLECSHTVVDVTFHNAAFDTEYGWSFRFFGPLDPGDDGSLGWYDFSQRAQRLPGSATKWRITLDANQFGSYRPLGDSSLFVGGPACYDDRLFRDGLEGTPDTGPPSCDH